MDSLRDTTRALRHQIRKTVRRGAESAGRAERVNVSNARNVVISSTSGESGAAEASSARQSVNVQQRDGESVEETNSNSQVSSRSDGVERRDGTVHTTGTVRTSTGGTADDE
jgi:hypothetical protein